MKKLIMLALILSSCAMPPKRGTSYDEIYGTHSVRLVNANTPGCTEAMTEALNWFYSYGHRIELRDDAKNTVVCAGGLPLLTRLLIPVRAKGYQSGSAAWVFVGEGKNSDAHTMIHEMRHLLFDEQHGSDLLPVAFSFK